MRLKHASLSLSAQHNGNENPLDLDLPGTDTTGTTNTTEYNTNNRNNIQQLNNLHNGLVFDTGARRRDTLQWCNTINTIQHQQDNLVTTERHQETKGKPRAVYNINNTLAASLPVPVVLNNSRCLESSPDDSLLDYEEAQQSCSSVSTSPQDEDRGFDLSDSESLSEDGNLSAGSHQVPGSRGIVNPNYPGFQHLAHTLDYSIKACSDAEYTDDDLELEDANNINNNNEEYKIDSVNRLDSVENIQKVFYDKPKLNIPLEFDIEKRNNCDSGEEASGEEASGSNSNDEDLEGNLPDSDPEDVKLNIVESISTADIVGNFGQEIECELEKIVAREIEQELEEAVEKLTVAHDLSPSALKYNFEPNSNEPFEKVQIDRVQVLESQIIQQEAPPVIDIVKEIVQEVEQESLTDQISKGVVLEPKKTVPDLVESVENLKKVQFTLEEEFVEFKPELVKEMAEIKVAKVTSTEALTLKLNQLPPPKSLKTKTADAFLSEVKDNLPEYSSLESLPTMEEKMDIDFKDTKVRRDSNRESEEKDMKMETDENEKFSKEEKTKDDIEKDEDSTVPRKKEKIDMNYVKKRRDSSQQIASLITIPRRELGGRNRENLANRRSVPAAREKKKASPEILGGFDVYNIETAMPKIDLDAIESHLRAAREEERRRRTDREEIRRRLAMGSEDDYYNGCDRPGRKPSLQARLQSGMNLQICFMNETASDTESPGSDTECSMEPKHSSLPVKPMKRDSKPLQPRPVSLPLGNTPLLQPLTQPMTEADFFARQARLQTEARMALAQAKEMAHMQMEVERQRQKKSPITEMIRSSLEKVGIPFPEERRRVSRQILTEMNVAQLQVIVNDLHTQIETLNENLVRYLMNRDDLHMEQDSMLVDIEDLTRYLGAKEQTVKEQKLSTQNNNIPPPSPAPASPLSAINNSVKPRLHRIASLVKK